MFMVRSCAYLIAVVVVAACSGASASDSEPFRTLAVFPSGNSGDAVSIKFPEIIVTVRHHGGRSFMVSKVFGWSDEYRVEVSSDAHAPMLVDEAWRPVTGSAQLGTMGATGVLITAKRGNEFIACRVVASRARKSAGILAECDK